MKKRATFVALALVGAGVLLVSQPSNAQVVKKGSGYDFSLDLKKGAVYKYSLVLSMTPPSNAPAGSSPMSQNLPVSMKVKEVTGGVATLEVNSTTPSMGGGKGTPSTQTIKVDRKGKVSGGAESGMFAALPAKPVKIGDSWKSTVNTRAGMGIPVTVNTTSTLKEVKAANGRQVAVISVKTSIGGSSNMKGSGGGTYVVDMKDGMVVNYDIAQTMTMTMTPPPPKAEAGKPAPKPAKPMVMTFPIKIKMTRA